MVALTAPAGARARSRSNVLWSLASLGVVVLGVAPRVFLTTSGIGDRSAAVMALLLSLGAWLAAWLVLSPRAAFLVVGVAMIGFDLASLRPRAEPAFDDRVAVYRTDQSLDFTVFAPGSLQQPAMLLLVQPEFRGPSAPYALAADVNGERLVWDCGLERRLQRLVLPVPARAVGGGTVAVRLRLVGAPDREDSYLTVYSLQGQLAPPLIDERARPPESTVCALSGG